MGSFEEIIRDLTQRLKDAETRASEGEKLTSTLAKDTEVAEKELSCWMDKHAAIYRTRDHLQRNVRILENRLQRNVPFLTGITLSFNHFFFISLHYLMVWFFLFQISIYIIQM